MDIRRHRILNALVHFASKDLWEFYLSVAIRAFGLSMVSLFIPIYMLDLGISVKEIFLYYIILYSVFLILVVPVTKISCRIGFKHTILFSIPLQIVGIIFLYFSNTVGNFYLVAIWFGVVDSIFWMGYHLYISKISSKSKRGKQLSVNNIFASLMNVASPFIGGLILAFFGFKVLFIVSIIIVFLSIIPLFLSKDVSEPFDVNLRLLFSNKKFKSSMAIVGYGADVVANGIIWPIFVYLYIISNYAGLGLLVTLSLLVSVVVAFVVGYFTDKHTLGTLKLGVLFNILVWVFRLLTTSVGLIYLIDMFRGFAKVMVDIPFDTITYNRAVGSEHVKNIVYREILLQVGKILIFVIMFFVMDYLIGFMTVILGNLWIFFL